MWTLVPAVEKCFYGLNSECDFLITTHSQKHIFRGLLQTDSAFHNQVQVWIFSPEGLCFLSNWRRQSSNWWLCLTVQKSLSTETFKWGRRVRKQQWENLSPSIKSFSRLRTVWAFSLSADKNSQVANEVSSTQRRLQSLAAGLKPQDVRVTLNAPWKRLSGKM